MTLLDYKCRKAVRPPAGSRFRLPKFFLLSRFLLQPYSDFSPSFSVWSLHGLKVLWLPPSVQNHVLASVNWPFEGEFARLLILLLVLQ